MTATIDAVEDVTNFRITSVNLLQSNNTSNTLLRIIKASAQPVCPGKIPIYL